MRKRRGAARNWHGAWQDFRVSEPAWRPIPRPNVIPAKAGTMNIYVQEERAAAQLYFQAPCSWIPAFAGMTDGEMNRYSSRPSWSRITRRSEEHTSELQSLMRISYAVFCLKKKKRRNTYT